MKALDYNVNCDNNKNKIKNSRIIFNNYRIS